MSRLDDFSRFARVIPEEYQPALRSNLKKIPDFSWLLGEPPGTEERLQGDLLKAFPTVFLDNSGKPHERKFTVMILNNTCDLPDGPSRFCHRGSGCGFSNVSRVREAEAQHKLLQGQGPSWSNQIFRSL
jgi:hypothetical protein